MAFFSRNNVPITKDGVYVINLDDQNSKGTRWISLFINKNLAIYFDSFGIEYIPQEVLNKVRDKPITHNIFRIQDKEYIMCGFYCFHRIYACRKNFARSYLLYNTSYLLNLFTPNDYKKEWQNNI